MSKSQAGAKAPTDGTEGSDYGEGQGATAEFDSNNTPPSAAADPEDTTPEDDEPTIRLFGFHPSMLGRENELEAERFAMLMRRHDMAAQTADVQHFVIMREITSLRQEIAQLRKEVDDQPSFLGLVGALMLIGMLGGSLWVGIWLLQQHFPFQ